MIQEKHIAEAINTLFSGLKFTAEPTGLYDPLRYMMDIGGKRIRPRLCLTAYSLYKDEFSEEILSPAAALEVFHSFTLIHDDIMDKAPVRRGVPTVYKKWNENTAILSGDVMSIESYKMLAKAPVEKLHQALELFSTTAAQVCEGQQYDMEFENRDDVTEEEYIEMIRLKTSVLLACAMKIGGILAGASAEDADNLYKFGEQVGLAFQLQDDLLDVYGDPKVFGKAVGGDITCNKKTYMLINAFQRANSEQRAELERWVSAKDFDRQEKVAAVTEIYNQIGIRHICEEKINYYFEESKKYLAKINVADERKQTLLQYTAEMMKRES